jgi:RsiW-degrading membrane proteinase PrsW (M82 family)
MPFAVVSITFMSGAILGLTIAAVVEPLFLPPTVASGSTIPFSAALLIALCEESAKVISIIWFLRDRRLRSELDGLILGAAAGMGFAALETAGYGFVAFLAGFTNSLSANPSTTAAIAQGIHQMNHSLILRMALAVFGHGVWTAIVCAAIWRDRRGSTLRLTLGVVLAFSIAVMLHALWDWTPLSAYLTDTTNPAVAVLVVFGWFLLIGAAGLFVLSFFLRESLRRAKIGPAVPPPPPLLRAILLEKFSSRRSW